MKKTMGIILVFILVIMLGIGVTYAYFSAKISGLESASTLVLEAGELEIDVDGGNIISVSKFIPDSEVPFATKTITLTGKNTSIYLNMPYSLKLVVDNNTFTTGSIKYSISGVNDSNSGKVIPEMEMKDAGSTTIIGSGYFERGNPLTHTYTLKMYFPETEVDQSENMAATYNAHIEVTPDEAEEPAPKGWWKAANGTLLAAIRDNSTLHIDETGMTIPGTDLATTDEQLRMATDDYGVSFYFRGNVQNNYVQFAGKCWKIVRVTGDGSIKLFLWNNNGTLCTSSSSASSNRYNSKTYTNDTGESVNVAQTVSGVGFMYGKPDATIAFTDDNTGAQDNINDSTILTNLKTWYKSTFQMDTTDAYTNLISDVIWCGDKSIYTGNGYGAEQTSFSARNRLIIQNPNRPNLICPNAGLNNKVSKYTANDTINGNGNLKGYKIGLLTADEAIFSGGKYNTPNENYYLFTNSYWWTMTPIRFDGTNAIISSIDASGRIQGSAYANNNGTIRPSVALNPTVQVTYNTAEGADAPGTVNNPYVVEI